VRVESFYAGVAGRETYVVLHQAASAGSHPPCGFVFCPAFGEEGECARRNFHLMALSLAEAGVPVVHADLAGTGNSAGEMADVRLADWIDGFLWCASCLRERVGVKHIGLLGLRLGCALALLALPRLAGVSMIVLWDPLSSPEYHLHSLLRLKLVREAFTFGAALKSRADRLDEARSCQVLDLDGYRISQHLISELAELSWQKLPRVDRARPRVAMACLGRRDASSELAAKVRQVLPQAAIEHLRLPGPVRPFWTRTGVSVAEGLIAATAGWIRRQVGTSDRAGEPGSQSS
jgi:hypothetical protein